MSRALLELDGVSKRFSRRTDRRLRYALGDAFRELRGLPPEDRLRDGEFWALRDIDLRIDPGEAVGLIGHNGAGKSTLMQIAAGILLPTTGSVVTRTGDLCRIDSAGVVSPLETARENILMQLALHRIPPAETETEIAAIADIADLGDRLDQEVGTYSTGMRGRLAFAIFARLRPELMLVDEGIGGGDRRFRDRFRGFLEDYLGEGGAMLFAMHDTNAITTFCDRVAVIEGGRLVTTADPATAIDAYNELAALKGLPPMPKPRPVRNDAARKGDPAAADAVEPGPPGPTVSVARAGNSPVQPGQPVELIVTIDSPEPLTDVGCVIELGRGELFPLARIRRRLLAIAAGTTSIRCTIAAWPLVAGRGELQARLLEGDSRRIVARSGPLVIQAGNPEGERVENRAVMHVEAAWGDPAPEAPRT